MKLLRTILLHPFKPAKRRLSLEEALCFWAIYASVWAGGYRLFIGPLSVEAIVKIVVITVTVAALVAWRDRNAPL